MRFDLFTIFPDFFKSPLKQSLLGKAIEKGLIEVYIHNIRDFAFDKHKLTDDYPYGGGEGMVMKAEPVVRAVEAVKSSLNQETKVILTAPQGRRFDHRLAAELACLDSLMIICGRYEGVDERIKSLVTDMEISVGDYILSGGETAAMVIVDTVSRLRPGVLGSDISAKDESFSRSLLEYPQYTRPACFRDLTVPEVLLSGNHQKIKKWRRMESIRTTWERRPDLLDKIDLTEEDKEYLKRLKAQRHQQ